MDWEGMIAGVADRAASPPHRTDMADTLPTEVGPPLDPANLAGIEAVLGFALPAPIREVYTRIGNGGFGPGYGLMVLRATERRAFGGNAVAVLNFLRAALADDEAGPGWPHGLLPVVHLGCSLYVCVDCFSADLSMLSYDADGPEPDAGRPVREVACHLGHGFGAWLDRWARFAPA
jgi:hypothetical protein